MERSEQKYNQLLSMILPSEVFESSELRSIGEIILLTIPIELLLLEKWNKVSLLLPATSADSVLTISSD